MEKTKNKDNRIISNLVEALEIASRNNHVDDIVKLSMAIKNIEHEEKRIRLDYQHKNIEIEQDENKNKIEHYNKLSPKQLEQLYILSEELCEVQQAVGKILRHGYESFSPFDDTKTPNRKALEREIGDVIFATTMLHESNEINFNECQRFANLKKEKVKPYLHHQENNEKQEGSK